MYAVRRSAPIILARNANGERVFAEHLTLSTKNVIDRMMVSPPASGQEKSIMSKPIVIEVAGKAVAVAAPAGDQVRFVAVKYDVWDLDGQFYGSVAEAERAAARHLAGEGAFSAPVEFAAAG
jgi:hypothetical protein